MLSIRNLHSFLALLASVFALPFATATAFAQSTHIKAEIVAEGPATTGETTMLAIHMRPDPGWHGYWLNPGDAGLGMVLDWYLPKGFEAGDPQYPVPHTLLVSGLMNHVYEEDYAVLVPLKIAKDAASTGRLKIAVDAQWLACTDEICIPEQGRLETTLGMGGTERRDARFDRWRARLPAPLDAEAAFEATASKLRIAIPLPATMALRDPHLFIAQDRIVDYPARQSFSRKGNVLIVGLKRPKLEAPIPERLSGVLRLNDAGDGIAFSATPGTVPSGGAPLKEEGSGIGASLPLLLAGAVLGGLLLNIMPCVFPILSLKALSLARAGESEAHARIEGLAYAAGVIVATMALGALMLGLRAAGEEIGWAFQLQEPGVVAALLMLACAITANFLGLFEFTVPGFATEGSPQGAFATGLLAAFVATPCTGPFMAAAMGAALLLPVTPAMALFAALGFGIALPFLAVAFIPAFRQRLPKPGPWMNRFRKWMALPMGLTALALLWLASRLGGTSFAFSAGLVATALVTVLAAAGRWQAKGKAAAGLVAAGLAATAIATLYILPRTVDEPVSGGQGLIAADDFSEEALAAARRSGKPVFAWFTADWCITCKVNEQVAIEREETRNAFDDAGVVVLRGDWTRRDPAITRYLTSQGAAGVPLYVWYPAEGGDPQQLPQVLTPGMLIDLAGKEGLGD